MSLTSGKDRRRIIVAGGGIAGLTVALALIDRGIDVLVLERNQQPQEVGAGVQISANALRVYDRLGLRPKLEALSGSPKGKVFRLWNTGQSWNVFDFSDDFKKKFGFQHLTLFRPDLYQVLLDAVRERRPEAIRLGCEVVGLQQTDTAVQVRLKDGSSIEGDALIGADGVHSVIRAAAISLDNPRYAGCVAWRGVVETSRLPLHLREPIANAWMGPGAHVIHYPLRGGELINFAGIVERVEWPAESWTAEGTRAECLRDLEGWHEDVRTLAAALSKHFMWALMVREPLSTWTSGRVTLIGDAAHAMLPFLSQGASQAIEDAYILARCIAELDHDLPDVFAAYEHARITRTTRIVRESEANMTTFHSPKLATPQGAAEYFETELAGATRDKWNWIYSYDVDTVPI